MAGVENLTQFELSSSSDHVTICPGVDLYYLSQGNRTGRRLNACLHLDIEGDYTFEHYKNSAHQPK